jgi:hypothetical protein
MPEKLPVIMFCGLPVIVATLPMLEGMVHGEQVRDRIAVERFSDLQYQWRRHQGHRIVDEK